MLNGVTKLSLDVKGRLAIPSRYRDRLVNECAGRMIVTVDHERRLVIYPLNDWKVAEAKLEQLSSFNKASVKIKRLYLGHANECDMDKNGRINLPSYLREITGLDKQIVLLGVGNKFEVWDEKAWNKEWESDENELELSEELEALSL